MNVAVVMGSYHGDNVGGAELQAHTIAECLQRGGHRVLYVAVRGISVEPSAGTSVRVIGLEAPDESTRTKELVSVLRDLEADVCYTRSFGDLPVTVHAAEEARVPLVVHVSSDSMTSWIAPFDSVAKSRPSRYRAHARAFSLMVRKPVRLICQTRGQAEDVMRAWRGDRAGVVVLPNLWNTRTTAPGDGVADAIMWIGPAKPVKRPGLFLAVVRRARVEGARFVLAGGTRGSRFARAIAHMDSSGRVEARGVVSPDEIDRMMDETAILVNTSRYEGFPNTFLQAFVHGVPVVSAGVDPDGVLLENRIGLVAHSRDELVRSVERLWAQPALRAEMGARARAYVERSHDVEKWWPAYERVLTEAACAEGAE